MDPLIFRNNGARLNSPPLVIAITSCQDFLICKMALKIHEYASDLQIRNTNFALSVAANSYNFEKKA